MTVHYPIENEAADAAFQPDYRNLHLAELIAQHDRSLGLIQAHLADAQLSLDKIKHFHRSGG